MKRCFHQQDTTLYRDHIEKLVARWKRHRKACWAAETREVVCRVSKSISIYPLYLQLERDEKMKRLIRKEGDPLYSTIARRFLRASHVAVWNKTTIPSSSSIYEDVWMYSVSVTLSTIDTSWLFRSRAVVTLMRFLRFGTKARFTISIVIRLESSRTHDISSMYNAHATAR